MTIDGDDWLDGPLACESLVIPICMVAIVKTPHRLHLWCCRLSLFGICVGVTFQKQEASSPIAVFENAEAAAPV